jgi:predicted DNA-binding transcriptional regulator AlpA
LQVQSDGESRFFSKKTVAERYGVHPVTVMKWVRAGIFPAPVKIGQHGLCRWPEQVMAAWEKARINEAEQRGTAIKGQASL